MQNELQNQHVNSIKIITLCYVGCLISSHEKKTYLQFTGYDCMILNIKKVGIKPNILPVTSLL